MDSDLHEGQSVRKRSLRLRRVLRRRWLFGLLPLFALVVALLWMAPTIVANTALMPKIISAALSDFEGRVTIGSASLGWLSPVIARDVAAVDTAGLPLAQIKSVQSERSLVGLLMNRRDPGEFRLEEPVVHLVLRPDGSNWEDALDKLFQQPASESAVDKVQLKITGGSVQIQDSAAGPWQIDALDVELRMSQRDPMWLQMRVGGQVQAAGTTPGQISAELACQAADGQGQSIGPGRVAWQIANLPLSPWDVVLRRAGVDVQLSGLASARGEFQWDAGLANPQLTLERLTGQQVALRAPHWLGSETLRTSSLDVRGNAGQTGDRWRLDNVALQCDFARLEARGTLPAQTAGANFNWLDLIRDLQKEDMHISGRLDAAALTAMLPNTLRIRPTTRITSGNVSFSLASKTLNEPSFSATLQAADLAAVDNGRPFAWKEPITATASFRYTPDGPVIDQLVCHAEFLDVLASGRLSAGSANVQGDLNRMATEIGRFVDLGEFRMAGRVDGQLEWKQSAAERLNATGRIKLNDFELSAAGSLPWREKQLVIDVAAEAQTSLGEIATIPSATFDLRSDRDQLTVRLTQPVQRPWPESSWPLDLQVSGRLETWLPRLQPVVSVQGWKASGAIELTASATVASDRLAADPVRLAFRELRAENAPLGVFIDENTVRLETAGTWDLATNRLQAADTTLTSSTIAMRAQQIDLQLPGERTSVRGTIGYRTDLGRLARCFQPPGQRVTSRLTGSATGTLRATHEDLLTRIDWTSDLVDFAYATLGAPPSGTPVRPVSTSESWQDVWREASIRLSGRQRYDHGGDLLHVDELAAATQTMKLAVGGRIDQLTTQATADLSGTLDYDLADVTRQFQASLGDQIRFAGKQQGQFQIAGPLLVSSTAGNTGAAAVVNASTATGTPPAGPLVPADWRGGLRAGWQSADVYGLQLGPGDLQGSLLRSVLHVQPLDIAVSQGRIRGTPRLDLNALPVRLMLDRGPLLENVRITPEMCQTWLKYVTPLLADATRAEGTFSLALDNADVPLPDSMRTAARGVLTIHSGRVGPGPLAQEFLGTAQQVRALIEGGVATAAGSGANTWLVIPEQQVPFDVQQGRVHHQGLTVMAGDLALRTSGSVGFDQTLALIAEVPVQDRWIANKRMLQGLKGTTLQLPIQGSFTQPKADRRALTDLNQQIIRNAAGGALEQELGRGLQQLFGPRP
jgi:translocation and assembly module TamB